MSKMLKNHRMQVERFLDDIGLEERMGTNRWLFDEDAVDLNEVNPASNLVRSVNFMERDG